MQRNILPGTSFPLGATLIDNGTNFAVYAENATAVDLCFFDEHYPDRETFRTRITERTGDVWHILIQGVKAGQLYGFRMHGPYEPENGHRFNPHKLLIDPNAKAVAGTIEWHDSLFGYNLGDEQEDLSFNEVDSAPFVPKCVVIDPAFNWENEHRPNTPLNKSIIYELHVKGFTKMHPEIPEEIRGSYAAIAHPASIKYLKSLGVTAVELMPVHHFITDRHLKEQDLTNYWGYNTIGFFAPDARYSSSGVMGEQVNEFKQMVKELHNAGMEVILDVVYNHTGEGNQMGPTVSFRGIDNATYYRLTDDKRYYMDYTGTGNTLNSYLPNVLRLIMDSLRYWIIEMHVDGFRFDLASALARELHEVDKLSAFFDIIYQDPVISQVKLIAEPWDVGEGGYHVGGFPHGWSEWNGKYRDCIRDYWRGEESMLGEFAERFTGSSDLYKGDFRTPSASINFVTAHDGFTLNDLVSYNDKHNLENGENNMDGESHNRSWNCSIEGPTDNEKVNKLRGKQKRNFLTTLFLSQGVPMLVAGDEFGRTQKGNNNAYCQDNEISWLHWEEADKSLLEFTRKLIQFRQSHPVFTRRRWFQGIPIKGARAEDIAWFDPKGNEMTEDHWNDYFAKSIAVYLNGHGIHQLGDNGEQLVDDNFYIIFNAHYQFIEYTLPPAKYSNKWKVVIDTATDLVGEGENLEAGGKLNVKSRSIMVLEGIPG